MKEYNKPHFGIILIALFYFLVALAVASLFVYTYITAQVPFVNRIFGIALGSVLGFSIFFIGFSIWKGQAWAQIVVILVSGGIILFNVIAYLIGRVVTTGSAIYLITMLVVNTLIIWYLVGSRAKRHFHKSLSFRDAITEVIRKHHEEHGSDNPK
jgi:hypothetical protein